MSTNLPFNITIKYVQAFEEVQRYLKIFEDKDLKKYKKTDKKKYEEILRYRLNNVQLDEKYLQHEDPIFEEILFIKLRK